MELAVVVDVWAPVAPVPGLCLGTAAAGIKVGAVRDDLGVMLFSEKTNIAGVFTQNAFAAAPVLICRERLSVRQDMRALVVNAGNANACTGSDGHNAALKSCEALASLKDCEVEQTLPFSTGVIGQPLPVDKLVAALPDAVNNACEDGWERFAKAIMTTDTCPKGASVSVELNGHTVTVSGVAKGAGMIRPNMATMLAFVATDAAVLPDRLRDICKNAANRSFNRITIDGDTSTNDALIVASTGESAAKLSEADLVSLEVAITQVCEKLAQAIVRDGEGATKFVEINVEEGATAQEALDVAYAVAHSPLVKTALFASDPNWGRIVAAIGYAGIHALDVSTVSVFLDEVCVVKNGGLALDYQETRGQSVFDKQEFTIRITLGRGGAAEKLWTSDLSHEYVRINAEYRT